MNSTMLRTAMFLLLRKMLSKSHLSPCCVLNLSQFIEDEGIINFFMMQLRAYVKFNANGSKPQRSMLTFTFDGAKVSDLCAYVADKQFCPPGSTYNVSLKVQEPGSADASFFAVLPEEDLLDGSEMFVVVDTPSGDTSSFQLYPAGSPSRSYGSQSPGRSQVTSMDATLESFYDECSQHPSSSQRSLPTTSSQTATPGNDANFMEQIGNLLSAQASVSDTPCTPPVAHVTLLTAAYLSQRQSVDDAFRGMKPVDPVLINNVDVHAFFDHPVRKAALFILQHPLLHSAELREAAKYQSKKLLVELLVKAYPE
uniref:Uncharacterized protein n=1 Tax=Panagrolaimus sp. ES5 TaxID=591445 RepID=A0AC34FFX6_9BILA